MTRKDIGTHWDRDNRNAINDNFKELYKSSANVGEAVEKANEAKQKADGVQKQFDKVVVEGDSSVEAAQARVKADGTTFDTLRDRLNLSDLELAHEVDVRRNQIQQVKNETQSYLDNQLGQIGSMTPQGAFSTLQDLENAYPDGKEGVFIIQENGHWYYFNQNENEWTDGGLYQATPWDGFMTEENESWVI